MKGLEIWNAMMTEQHPDELSLPLQVHHMRDRLARNLAAARTALGISQDNLAIAAGISRTTLNQLENAEGDPRLSTVVALSFALGISPAFLLLGREEMLAIAQSASSEEAQQVNEELSEEDLGTMERLLGSGVAKNRSKAVTMALKAVGQGWGPGALAAAAIGTTLVPGIGTAIGAGLGAFLYAKTRAKKEE